MSVDFVVAVVGFLSFAALMAWKHSWFVRHKSELAAATVDANLHFEDFGDRTRVWGMVNGHEIQVETEIRNKYSRNRYISVNGYLKLTDAPAGLCIHREGIDSGLKRMANHSELEFDHLDFDNAFWVTAEDQERAFEYLDKNKRDALLHWMVRFGGGSIEDRTLRLNAAQMSEMSDTVGPMLSQFIGIAKAFSGDSQYHQSTSDLVEGWVATQRLRVLAFWTGLLALIFWVLPLEVHLPDVVVTVDHVLMALSAVTCVLALLGKRTAIVVIGGLLGVATASALAFMAIILAADGHLLEAVIPGSVAGVWSILWGGLLFQLASLKMKK